MLLQFALIVMTGIVALFVFAWARSPALRRVLEEPKYSILENETKSDDH
ncbi:MAG: hypothetical protein U0103_12490 [Candidatus Obscuribacterales bacterium]